MTSTGKGYRFGLALSLMLLSGFQAIAQQDQDTTPKTNWTINPRLHTSGYFPFTGALLNRNWVADVNVFMEKKAWGFFLFQSVDLEDRHSYVNYMQPGIFATLRPSQNLRLRAFFGYILSQTNSFCDPESDYYTAVQVNWNVTPSLRIENTLLFYDYSLSKKLANRFLVEWASGAFRISGYLWQRTVLDENSNSTSGSLAVTYAFRLSEKASVELTGSFIGYLTQSIPDFALRKGAFLTVAVPLTFH